jgi:hypothetical protein
MQAFQVKPETVRRLVKPEFQPSKAADGWDRMALVRVAVHPFFIVHRWCFDGPSADDGLNDLFQGVFEPRGSEEPDGGGLTGRVLTDNGHRARAEFLQPRARKKTMIKTAPLKSGCRFYHFNGLAG